MALGFGLVFLIIKKHLAELAIISITLFVTVGLFMLLFIVQICANGLEYNTDQDYKQYWRMKFDLNLITAFSIVLVGYGFQ